MSNTQDDEPKEISDLSELSFTFEDSRTDKTSADDRHNGLDINAFTLDSDKQSPRDAESPDPAPSIDSFQISGNEAAAELRAAPPTGWHARSLGQEFGPLTLAQVISMVADGTLGPKDEVRPESQQDWVVVDSVNELAVSLPKPPTSNIVSESAGDEGVPKTKSVGPQGGAKSTGAKAQRKKKKRPRKKKPKKDELLEEIFTEVFTEDGGVRQAAAASAVSSKADDSPTAERTVAANAPAETPSVPPADPAPTNMNSGSSGSPPTTTQSGQPAAFAANAANAMAQPRMPARPITKSKSSSRISLSDPPVMWGGGIAGVVLLLMGIYYMGWMPVGGPNPNAMFRSFESRYATLSTGNPTADEWKAFREEFRDPMYEIGKTLMTKAKTDPSAKKVQDTVNAMFQVLASGHDDKEAQKEAYAKYEQLRSS